MYSTHLYIHTYSTLTCAILKCRCTNVYTYICTSKLRILTPSTQTLSPLLHSIVAVPFSGTLGIESGQKLTDPLQSC